MANIVTYNSLADMLTVKSRWVFQPNSDDFGWNIVGSGSVVSVPIPQPSTMLLFGIVFSNIG